MMNCSSVKHSITGVLRHFTQRRRRRCCVACVEFDKEGREGGCVGCDGGEVLAWQTPHCWKPKTLHTVTLDVVLKRFP